MPRVNMLERAIEMGKNISPYPTRCHHCGRKTYFIEEPKTGAWYCSSCMSWWKETEEDSHLDQLIDGVFMVTPGKKAAGYATVIGAVLFMAATLVTGLIIIVNFPELAYLACIGTVAIIAAPVVFKVIGYMWRFLWGEDL